MPGDKFSPAPLQQFAAPLPAALQLLYKRGGCFAHTTQNQMLLCLLLEMVMMRVHISHATLQRRLGSPQLRMNRNNAIPGVIHRAGAQRRQQQLIPFPMCAYDTPRVIRFSRSKNIRPLMVLPWGMFDRGTGALVLVPHTQKRVRDARDLSLSLAHSLPPSLL